MPNNPSLLFRVEGLRSGFRAQGLDVPQPMKLQELQSNGCYGMQGGFWDIHVQPAIISPKPCMVLGGEHVGNLVGNSIWFPPSTVCEFRDVGVVYMRGRGSVAVVIVFGLQRRNWHAFCICLQLLAFY